MPRGDWFSYVALGLITGFGLALVYMTTLAFLNGYLVTNNPYGAEIENGSELAERHQDDGYVPPYGQSSGDDISKLKARENPDDPKYYEEQDRRAQKGMADATQAIVWLTQVSIVLGLVGAGAIIWNLRETRIATKVAVAAVAATERSGEVGTQAYVHNSDVREKDGRVIICFHNSGQTPAFECSVNWRCNGKGGHVVVGTIGAGDSETADIPIKDIGAGKVSISGEIRYWTIWQKWFYSEFKAIRRSGGKPIWDRELEGLRVHHISNRDNG